MAAGLRDTFGDHDEFFRPLAMPYFAALIRWFGLDCRAHHGVALALHAGSGVLVARVLRRICRDELVAWLAAFLYVAAFSVHHEPLMWAVGMPDIVGGDVLRPALPRPRSRGT